MAVDFTVSRRVKAALISVGPKKNKTLDRRRKGHIIQPPERNERRVEVKGRAKKEKERESLAALDREEKANIIRHAQPDEGRARVDRERKRTGDR